MNSKLSLRELPALREDIDSVRILSTLGGMYKVELIINGEQQALHESDPPLPLFFRNLLSAKIALRTVGLNSALLVQPTTARGETIGLSHERRPPERRGPYEVPISLIEGDIS